MGRRWKTSICLESFFLFSFFFCFAFWKSVLVKPGKRSGLVPTWTLILFGANHVTLLPTLDSKYGSCGWEAEYKVITTTQCILQMEKRCIKRGQNEKILSLADPSTICPVLDVSPKPFQRKKQKPPIHQTEVSIRDLWVFITSNPHGKTPQEVTL